MDGKEFVHSFRTGLPEDIDYASARTVEDVHKAAQQCLVGSIALLYGQDEVFKLGAEPPPEAVTRIITDRSVNSPIVSELQAAANNRVAPDKPSVRHRNIADLTAADISANLSTQELTELMRSARADVQRSLYTYSSLVFDQAILNGRRQIQRGRSGQNGIGQAVKDAVTNFRRVFAEQIIRPQSATIAVERDFNLKKAKPDKQLDFRVVVQTAGGFVSAWLRASDEWYEPLQLLCATYVEMEAFIAIQEWGLARGLPDVPIMAPPEFEQGDLWNQDAPNPRADILLCSLMPDRNEIIPVQVKNRVTPQDRREYDRGVLLMGSRELGLQTLSHPVIEYDGRRQTGYRVTTTYGKIIEHFLQVRGAGKRTPSKQAKQAYMELLEPAFKFLDEEVGTPKALGKAEAAAG